MKPLCGYSHTELSYPHVAQLLRALTPCDNQGGDTGLENTGTVLVPSSHDAVPQMRGLSPRAVAPRAGEAWWPLQGSRVTWPGFQPLTRGYLFGKRRQLHESSFSSVN